MNSKILSDTAIYKIETCMKLFDRIVQKSKTIADIDYDIDINNDCAYVYLQTPLDLSFDLDDSVALREIVDSVELCLTDNFLFEPTDETEDPTDPNEKRDLVLKATIREIFN